MNKNDQAEFPAIALVTLEELFKMLKPKPEEEKDIKSFARTDDPAKDLGRQLLKKMVDDLVDLADQGDRGCQNLLLNFLDVGRLLIETASKEPGKPCPDCGKIH